MKKIIIVVVLVFTFTSCGVGTYYPPTNQCGYYIE